MKRLRRLMPGYSGCRVADAFALASTMIYGAEKGRAKLLEELDDDLAYLCRHMRIGLGEAERLTMRRAYELIAAVSRLVILERKASGGMPIGTDSFE